MLMLDRAADSPSSRMPRPRRTVEEPPSAPARKAQSTAVPAPGSVGHGHRVGRAAGSGLERLRPAVR